jgi:hypothetical protein
MRWLIKTKMLRGQNESTAPDFENHDNQDYLIKEVKKYEEFGIYCW